MPITQILQPSPTQQTFQTHFLPLIILHVSCLRMILFFKRLQIHFNQFTWRQTLTAKCTQYPKATPSKARFADEVGTSNAHNQLQHPPHPAPTQQTIQTLLISHCIRFFLYPIGQFDFKDAIFKKIPDCINIDNDERCWHFWPQIHSHWKDLHLKNGCVCVDDEIAIPNSIKDAYIKAIHATHPGSLGMIDIAIHAWWSYRHQDLLSKTASATLVSKLVKKIIVYFSVHRRGTIKVL